MLLLTHILPLALGLFCAESHGRVVAEQASSVSLQSRAGGAFVHPGVFVDAEAIERMQTQLKAGKQPWKGAYDAMMKHQYASIDEAQPFETVECGEYSKPNKGCDVERSNAMAAYLNALSWAATRNQEHAGRAIALMNAWAKTIKNHNNTNAPLQAAWAAVDWARAGEIIRHTGAGWDEAEVKAFAGMLENVYLPKVKDGAKWPNNWELVLMEASVSIAVFLDKRDIYDKSIERFKRSTAQYIYMKSDGPYPLLPQGITRAKLLSHWWNGQKEFKEDGMAMEVCRDLTHTGYGLASISHVAETARIQGLDLYKQDVGKRLLAGLEFQARYDKRGGAEKVPAWLCKGQLKLALEDVTEPAFSRLANSGKDNNMPFTKKLTMAARPARANTLFVGWETLTHAQDGVTTQQNKVKSPWSFWRR